VGTVHVGTVHVGTGASPVRAEQSSAADPTALAQALAARQDFLTLWKDADPDVPLPKRTKAEHANLQPNSLSH
jgi:hypothetical protein